MSLNQVGQGGGAGSDVLGALAKIGIGGGQAVANAMQAQGNPAAFQAAQQQKMEQMREAFQQQQNEAQAQQQDFQNQLQMALGIGSGKLKQIPAGTPGALSGSFEDGLNVAPVSPQMLNIPKTSDLGHWLNLDQDINNVPMDDYLKLAQTASANREKYNQLSQTRQAIDLAGVRLKQHIGELYSPERYMQLYGQVDPDLATRRQAALDQAEEAAASDKKLGTGTTEINRMFDQLTKGTPWEQRMLKGQQQEQTRLSQEAARKEMFQFEHPDPTNDEIKAQAANTIKNGLGSTGLAMLKAIHPNMVQLVDKELNKQGTSLAAITNEEQNNRGKAGIALNTMSQFMPILEDPAMKDTFGPLGGRWQDFMSGVGTVPNQQWKVVQDKLHLVSALIRNMHFGVRGGANENIQKEFRKIADASTMDYNTLRTGLRDFHDILMLYSMEGGPANDGSGGGAPTPQQNQIIPRIIFDKQQKKYVQNPNWKP